MRKLIAFAFLFVATAEAQPVIQSVANAASFQTILSPGSLATIFGKSLTAATGATTVTVGAKAAYVLTGGTASVISVELPVDLTIGPTTMTVTAGGQTSTPFNLTISAYTPALFAANGSGSGVGAFADSMTGKVINATNPATPGENVTGIAVGLGATNPPLATGAVTTGVANTVAKATLTMGGEAATVLFAGALPNSSIPGLYQVNFTVPTDASGCATNVVLTIGGVSSPPVTLPIITPLPVLCAVQNSATGSTKDAAHGAAPNSFIAVYAASLGVAKDSAGNIFPATDYQGLEVLFNGTPAPLYNYTAAANLINAAVPSELATSGSAVVTVKNSSGASQSYTMALAPADLGVFRLPDSNVATRVQGVVLIAGTYWFAMPASLARSYNLPACTGLPASSPCGQPAKPGDNIVIYLTGGGLAAPGGDPNGKPVPTGSVAPVDGSVIYKTVQTLTLTIGGIAAPVGFSGIAPGTASEYQINTTIPPGVQPGDDVPIVLTMGSSTDTITIAVQAP